MMRRAVFVGVLLLIGAACEGLEITLEPSSSPPASAGSSGADAGSAGAGAGGAALGGSGETNSAMGTAGAAAAGGLPPLVCSGDNWTSDEALCIERGGPPVSCKGTELDWHGCRGTGCGVCRELVADYPYYFDRHPCCVPNDNCAGKRYPCNVACPAPDEFDKIPLCASK